MLCDVNFADWSAWEGHGSWVPLSTLGYPKSPKSCGAKLRNSSFCNPQELRNLSSSGYRGSMGPHVVALPKRSGPNGTEVGRDGSGEALGIGHWSPFISLVLCLVMMIS